MLDLSKYPLEKLFAFAAAIIPGSVAIFIYEAAAPGALVHFLSLSVLGYKMKLALLLFAAFVIGLTIMFSASNSFLVLSSLVSAWNARRNKGIEKPPSMQDAVGKAEINAPWRDPRWRVGLRKHLGNQSPNDTYPLFPQVYNQRLANIQQLPANQHQVEIAKLNFERAQLEIDDSKWFQWYSFYHQRIVHPDSYRFEERLRYGLSVNFLSTGLYGLLSMIWVSEIRHLWFFLLFCVWLVSPIYDFYLAGKKRNDWWRTLDDRIEYLLR